MLGFDGDSLCVISIHVSQRRGHKRHLALGLLLRGRKEFPGVSYSLQRYVYEYLSSFSWATRHVRISIIYLFTCKTGKL